MKNYQITQEQAEAIEQNHNVYVDIESMQYNVGGGYDATYGWTPIPPKWIEEIIG